MVNSLVENAIYWLNAFPTKSGASSQLSPASIVLGRQRPEYSKPHIAFGSYAVVFNVTSNNTTQQTIPAIALKPSNQHGGSYFMSLISGRRIHAYQWKEVPISSEIIDRVDELAEKEDQPLLHDGIPIFEWEIGVPVGEEPGAPDGEEPGVPVEEYELQPNVKNNEIQHIDNEQQLQNDAHSKSNDEISIFNDQEEEIDDVLPDDPQQHSIDNFFEEESNDEEDMKPDDVVSNTQI